jgi:hypothetical protein
LELALDFDPLSLLSLDAAHHDKHAAISSNTGVNSMTNQGQSWAAAASEKGQESVMHSTSLLEALSSQAEAATNAATTVQDDTSQGHTHEELSKEKEANEALPSKKAQLEKANDVPLVVGNAKSAASGDRESESERENENVHIEMASPCKDDVFGLRHEVDARDKSERDGHIQKDGCLCV